jgi:hypothetical protein
MGGSWRSARAYADDGRLCHPLCAGVDGTRMIRKMDSKNPAANKQSTINLMKISI